MRLGILIWLAISVSNRTLVAQDCPAVMRVLPGAFMAGALDSSSCTLTDGSSYAVYRLDLPVRGQIRIDLKTLAADLTLLLRDASGARVDGGTSIRRPLEAGAYTLLVNGRTLAIAGLYQMTSAFTA